MEKGKTDLSAYVGRELHVNVEDIRFDDEEEEEESVSSQESDVVPSSFSNIPQEIKAPSRKLIENVAKFQADSMETDVPTKSGKHRGQKKSGRSTKTSSRLARGLDERSSRSSVKRSRTAEKDFEYDSSFGRTSSSVPSRDSQVVMFDEISFGEEDEESIPTRETVDTVATACAALLNSYNYSNAEILAGLLSNMNADQRNVLQSFLGYARKGNWGVVSADYASHNFTNASWAYRCVATAKKTQVIRSTVVRHFVGAQFNYSIYVDQKGESLEIGVQARERIPLYYSSMGHCDVMGSDFSTTVNMLTGKSQERAFEMQNYSEERLRIARSCAAIVHFNLVDQSSGPTLVKSSCRLVHDTKPTRPSVFRFPKQNLKLFTILEENVTAWLDGKSSDLLKEDPVAAICDFLPQGLTRSHYWLPYKYNDFYNTFQIKDSFDKSWVSKASADYNFVKRIKDVASKHKQIRKSMGKLVKIPEFDYYFTPLNFIPRTFRRFGHARYLGASSYYESGLSDRGPDEFFKDVTTGIPAVSIQNWISASNQAQLNEAKEVISKASIKDEFLVRMTLMDRSKTFQTAIVNLFKSYGMKFIEMAPYEQKHSEIFWVRVSKTDKSRYNKPVFPLEERKIGTIIVNEAARVYQGELVYMLNCYTGFFPFSGKFARYDPIKPYSVGAAADKGEVDMELLDFDF